MNRIKDQLNVAFVGLASIVVEANRLITARGKGELAKTRSAIRRALIEYY